jgi:hypothetical protein
VAGVIAFGLDAVPDRALIAIAVDLFRRIGLHASQAFGFFGFRPIEVPHDCLEFFVPVPGGDVHPAHAVVQAAWRHKSPVLEFILAPSLHAIDHFFFL